MRARRKVGCHIGVVDLWRDKVSADGKDSCDCRRCQLLASPSKPSGTSRYSVCGFFCKGALRAPRAGAPYSGAIYKKRVVVFVHGLFSDADYAWRYSQTVYWPKLLLADDVFQDSDVYVAAYSSPYLGNTMNLDEVVASLENQLVSDEVFSKHREVVFVCHSLGGLVVQRLLLTFREHAQQVPFIYFFSTPETGAQIANIAQAFSSDPLLQALLPGGENEYLQNLENEWKASKFRIHRFCAYEKKKYKGILIVDRLSSTRNCDDPPVPINENHSSIVKPDGVKHPSYIALRNAFIQYPIVIPKTLVQVAPPRLKGDVVENAESGPPMGNITVSAGSDAVPTVSDYKTGAFALVFQRKKAGDAVHLHVNKEGYVVVNDFQLSVNLPSEPDSNPVTIILCKKADQEEMRGAFYRVKSNQVVDAKYKELEDRYTTDPAAIEQLQKERDVAKALAAKGADEFAKQDIETASKLYRQATQSFLGGNVDESIQLLDEDKLNQQLKVADDLKSTANAMEQHLVQEWLLRARLLTLKFRVYEADYAYKKAVEVSPNDVDAARAYALFKESGVVSQAQTANIFKCPSPCGPHGPYPDVMLEGVPGNLPNAKALTGSSRVLAARLSDLIDEGNLLVRQFFGTDDVEFLNKNEIAWQGKVEQLLSPSLDSRLIETLSKVSSKQFSEMNSHNQQGISICNSIKGKTDLLTMYYNQLIGVAD
jgi:pimeloyl-ACP methyl ester carboxylesterase